MIYKRLNLKELIAIILFFATAISILLLPINLVAQEYVVKNGGSIILASGTYSNTIATVVEDNTSTGALQIGTSVTSIVSLTGDLSKYYGPISFFNGAILNLNLSNANTPAKITVEGTSASTTIVKKGGSITIGGYTINNATIELKPYGVLDLTNAANTGNLTLAKSLYLTGYNAVQPGQVRFNINSATPNQLITTIGKIYTDDPTNGRIDVSKHFYFNMKDAPGTLGHSYSFVFAHTETVPSFTGTPNVVNGSKWSDITVTAVAAGGGYDLQLNGTLAYNSYTWNGNAHDNNWFTPDNWDSNAVPDNVAHAIIPPATYQPTINGETLAQCRDLTIQTGAIVTIGTGGSITVNGNLTNDAGVTGLIMQSDFSGTGSLKIVGSTSGLAEVQRYKPTDKLHLVSAPAIQSIYSFMDKNIDIPVLLGVTPITFDMRDYNPATNDWSSFFTANITGNLSVGKGYLLRILTSSNQKINYKGTLSSGIINVPLTRTGAATKGWNLIGNPFTTAISINSAASNASGGVNFMGINTNAFETDYVGIYIWNDVTKEYDNINYSNPAVYAQSGQGFFVRAKTDGSTMEFNPSMQVHQNTVTLKAGTLDFPQIKLMATNNNKTASTMIKFIEGTTRGLDVGYDAGLFKSDQGLNIYTRLVEDNGVDFQLQCLPITDYLKMVIPVGLDSKAGGDVVFSAETSNLATDCKVIFEDKLSNSFTDLSRLTYKTTVAANTSVIDRFYLHTGDIVSGIDDQVLDSNLMAFAVRNVEIRVLGEVSSKAVAMLYDMMGKLILVRNMDAGMMNTIALPPVPDGTYMLNIKDNGTSQTIKILIRR
jgi:hypothetical protein